MLKEKIVLITGASRGIGKESALLLSKNTATVIVNYNKSEKDARELVESIKKEGSDASMLKADVSREDEVKSMFDEIFKKYGRLDVLVNNAGILKKNLLLMTKTEEYEKVMDVNAKGTFLCMRYAGKIMMKRKSGKIINLSSIMGVHGSRGYVAYSGSKAAVIGMTKAAAQELGAFGITVNAIAPGIILTDMIADVSEEIKKESTQDIALGRIGTPEDVARVVLFLSSNLSDYVSGQIIGVDGSQIIM